MDALALSWPEEGQGKYTELRHLGNGLNSCKTANGNTITADHQNGESIFHIKVDALQDVSHSVTSYNSMGSLHDDTIILPAGDKKHRVYWQRWLMLALFCSYSFSNAFQWIHLNIIYHVINTYYNDSLPSDSFQRSTAIDWLSLVYMIAYIPLIFPANWLLNKKGLRICNIAGSFLNAVAAWIKCGGVSHDRFAVLMVAQTVAAISQIWVLGIPARLAAVWFGPNEVSTATSIGVFGNQVGIAMGFLVPPEIVPNSGTVENMGKNLSYMFYGTAALTTVVFLVIIIFFKDKPPSPPSRAQQHQLDLEVHADYGKSLLNLVKNIPFVILTLAYGISTGSFYAVSTLLNNIILNYFPSDEVSAGRIGLTLVLAGIVGSIVAGIWLDRTKTFKGTSLAIYILSTGSMAAFTFTLDFRHLWVVYLTGGLLGLTMTGYLSVGFEYGAELTFPESEGNSSGLLNFSAQVIGIALTMGMRGMMERYSVLAANISVTVLLFVGAILTVITKANYRRQAAGKEIVDSVTNIEINVGEAMEKKIGNGVKKENGVVEKGVDNKGCCLEF